MYTIGLDLAVQATHKAHGMRNEMYIEPKWLHRLFPCPHFVLARDQK
jgi:hypothetical protein